MVNKTRASPAHSVTMRTRDLLLFAYLEQLERRCVPGEIRASFVYNLHASLDGNRHAEDVS